MNFQLLSKIPFVFLHSTRYLKIHSITLCDDRNEKKPKSLTFSRIDETLERSLDSKELFFQSVKTNWLMTRQEPKLLCRPRSCTTRSKLQTSQIWFLYLIKCSTNWKVDHFKPNFYVCTTYQVGNLISFSTLLWHTNQTNSSVFLAQYI